MDVQLYDSADGSFTLYVPELDETYHNRRGAWEESEYVFVEQGLNRFRQNSGDKEVIHVFEMGMGTGLNVLATLDYLGSNPTCRIAYTAIEPFPIPSPILEQIPLDRFVPNPKLHEVFYRIHQIPTDEYTSIHPQLDLQILPVGLSKFIATNNSGYDVIYWDAFAPKKQPELWTENSILPMIKRLNAGGVFTTYSAIGALKRMLKAANLTVIRPPGIHGKREMTVGVK